MSAYETASLTVSVMSALISLGALIFVGLQVRQGVRESIANAAAQSREWEQRRREASFSFYLETLEQRGSEHADMPASYDSLAVAAWLAGALNDSSKAAKIRSYLSLWELLSTGVNLSVLDEEIVDRFAGTSAVTTWNNYYDYILAQRKGRAEETVYKELEIFASHIASKHGYSLRA